MSNNINTRPKLKDIVAYQLPEFVREEYPTFVAFVEAYYEFLDANNVDLTQIRDIDTTLDDFIQYFKSELAHNYPVNSDKNTDRYLLKHIKDQYLAKGSEASYKLLFRLLYGKDVYMDYPGKQMLRVSDGRWQQDVSVFVRVDLGNAVNLIGKTVDVQTSKKIYRTTTLAGGVTKVTANIENVLPFAGDIYEVFLDRNFYGDILPGDVIKYKSEFQGQVLPVSAKVRVQNRGAKFSPGQVFQVASGEGTSIWFKVLATTSYTDDKGVTYDGGLKTIDVIKFGLGYNTDFSITVLPSSAVSARKKITKTPVAITYSLIPDVIGKIDVVTGGYGYAVAPEVIVGGNGSGATAHAEIENGEVVRIVVDNQGIGYTTAFINIIPQVGDSGDGATGEVTLGSNYNYEYKDNTTGFSESGYLNYGDYWTSEYSDGAYVGTIARQFFVDSKDTVEGNPALLNVELGALAKYPGYYKTNDGFLSDSMFIQDSYYYQAFSYVIRIDEQLQKYASVVRTMLHPSGMAMFGEYSINNNINLSIGLSSLVKSLGITLYDEVFAIDFLAQRVSKDLSDANINPLDILERFDFGKAAEDSVAMIDPSSEYKTYFNKAIGFTGQFEHVFAIEDGGIKDFSKSLEDTHYLAEIYTRLLTTKDAKDYQPVDDSTWGLDFTLNTIDDPLPGVYPEEGYLVRGVEGAGTAPFEMGGYFSEIYVNTRNSTF